tara:strand:- start:8454 stop:9329 length:876 start_codon:yes stop_codon:yes gene_type:complete
MKKILILGSSGILGKQLYKELKKLKNIKIFHTGLKKRIIDINDRGAFKNFIYSIKPNLIINCIAYTNVDSCESHKHVSKKVNYKFLQELFKIKKQKKLKFNFIHFSTDQFYNLLNNKKSNEKSKIYLINNYCKHKRKAELICLKNKCLVLRTNFFGKSDSTNKSFSDWIFKAFTGKQPFNLFKDIYFNPLGLSTIVKIISMIIITKKYKFYGLYNLAAKDAMYKDQFAIQFSKKVCIYRKNYVRVNSDQILKVKRSRNMFMCVKKFEKKFNFNFPNISSEINKEAKKYINL